MKKNQWNSTDQQLINWFNDYLKQLEKKNISTRDLYAYWEFETLLGPTSPRAQTGVLQKGLRLMKELVEREWKQ